MITPTLNIDRIPAEEIYLKYGEINSIRYKKAIKSPLRPDKNPSFSFIPFDNTVLWKDFATGETGNVITFVAKKLRVSNQEALEKIQKDFKGFDTGNSDFRKYRSIYNNKNYELLHIPKNFTKVDEDYWTGRYYLPISFIKKESGFAVNKVLLKTTKWTRSKWVYLNTNPIYGFSFWDNSFKYYRPYGKKGEKFVQTSKTGLVCYLDQLDNTKDKVCIIAKGIKDRLILKYLGFRSVCMIGERVIPSEKNISDIRKTSEQIIYIGDNDSTGLDTIKKYEKLGIKSFCIEKSVFKCKDIPDFTEKYGLTETKNYLNNLIYATA